VGSSKNFPHNDEFPSPMMDMVLGYKYQHLQESYVTDFFFCEQNNLRIVPTIPRHDRRCPQPE
jgi:hypothetical protein